jgi:hypothetical protein
LLPDVESLFFVSVYGDVGLDGDAADEALYVIILDIVETVIIVV